MSSLGHEAGDVALLAEVDNSIHDDDDNDSAFGSEGVESSTCSINSMILKHREENGRTYHTYKDGKYVLPNDEDENDRLDLQHHLFFLTFDGKLSVCPIPKEKQLHHVLDVGTGTGIWAIDFADEHPESQVLGIDLSAIQPLFTPPNLMFEIDDLEEQWTFSRKFDYIHCRMMTGSFLDWPRFFEQCYEYTNPGGFIEVADISFPVRTDDGSLPANSALRKWSDLMLLSAKNLGRFSNSAESYKSQIIAAGFENVEEVIYRWPQNQWPKDPKLKEIGIWNLENFTSGLSGLSLRLFTYGLGWTAEEVEVFLVDVRKAMRDTKIHSWYPIHVVYGQKPL